MWGIFHESPWSLPSLSYLEHGALYHSQIPTLFFLNRLKCFSILKGTQVFKHLNHKHEVCTNVDSANESSSCLWEWQTPHPAEEPNYWYFSNTQLFYVSNVFFTSSRLSLTFLPIITGFLPSYYFSSFPLFSHSPILGGFSSVSQWFSHSRQRSNQLLTSCLKPAWMSAPPVTPNATRKPHARATRTCGSFWPTRLSTPMANSQRRLLGSMALSPLHTIVPPTRQGHPGRMHGHMWGESDRSLDTMGDLALQDRTFCWNIHFQCPSNYPLVVLVHLWGTAMSSQLHIVFTMVKTM